MNADDTSALEPSAELVERHNPDLAPMARHMEGHESFIKCDLLKRMVGWTHASSWRGGEEADE